MTDKIVAIDLFCGAGGLTRGLLDAGIDVICGFDIESAAQQSYEENNIRRNGEKVRYIRQSVTEITKEQIFNIIGKPDKRKVKFLLAGCAPCQPFSRLNKDRLNPKDPRRTLLRYFADLVAEVQPDFVMMENVAGIASLESDVLEYFVNILDRYDYRHDKKIVNAVNYGVPQNRKRYVLLASKHGDVKIPVAEFDGKKIPYKKVCEFIKYLPPIKAGEEHPSISNHKSRNLSDLNMKRIIATPKNGGSRHDWTDTTLMLECHKNTNGFRNVYGRISWESPAPTLTTKFNAYTSGRFGHPEQNRALSLKEGALLQTFSENYVFFGGGDTVARQIGNAVPPLLACKIISVLTK